MFPGHLQRHSTVFWSAAIFVSRLWYSVRKVLLVAGIWAVTIVAATWPLVISL